MHKVFLTVFVLVIVTSILALNRCAGSNIELPTILRDCNPKSIEIRGSDDYFFVSDVASIGKILHWLEKAETVDIRYASYPMPSIKIIMDCVDKKTVNLSISYPGGPEVPEIVEYKGDYFSVPEVPHIKEFDYFRDRFSDKSITPSR